MPICAETMETACEKYKIRWKIPRTYKVFIILTMKNRHHWPDYVPSLICVRAGEMF